MNFKNLIIDVDGVLTTGQFFYSAEGKIYKVFGNDDHDALSLLRNKVNIVMVTGDKKGFAISKKRIVDDMHFPLELVSTFERVAWIKERYDLKETIYIGDGIYDGLVFTEVGYSIAPANAFFKTKEKADFVTISKGGEGAVAEACVHLMDKFFEPFEKINIDLIKNSGAWNKNQ